MSKLEDFERIGGRASLIAINKAFYDKVYLHPWLKHYFLAVPQQHIEDQQVDFMQKVLGGKNLYVGKSPPIAHKHMFIPDELFEVRKQLLIEAFNETKAHPDLVDKWLNLDESFRRLLVKKSLSECVARYKSEGILNFKKPE